MAIIRKAITGAWMNAFYRRDVNNLGMRDVIKEAVERLEAWHAQPHQMIPLRQDVLGNNISEDATLNLSLAEDTPETILKPLLGATIDVFQRQFYQFLEGRLADPSPEDITKAENACSHNMAAERILGLMDNMCRKAPNATGALLSG